MSQTNHKKRRLLRSPFQGWKHSQGVRYVLLAVVALLLFFSLNDALVSQTYALQVGQVSEKDIKAPRQIIDKVATEKAQQEAGLKEQEVFTNVSMRNSDFIDAIFNTFEKVNTDDQLNTDQKASVYRNYFPSEYDYFFENIISGLSNNDALQDEIRKQLERQKYRIPEDVYFKFHLLTTEDLATMEPIARQITNRLMREQVTDVELARAKVPELVNASSLNKQLARELVQEVVRFVLTPNRFFDEQATAEAKEQAKASVDDIYIMKNDIIVAEGEEISEQTYLLLEELGLLKDKRTIWPQLGLAIFILLITFVMFVLIRHSEHAMSTSNVPLLMFVLIIILNVVGMKLVSLGQTADLPYIGYLAPVAMGSMLIAILLDVRIAFISAVLFSILASVIFNVEHSELIFDFRYGFVALIGSFVAIFAIRTANQRAAVLKAGVFIAIFSCLTVFSFLLLGYPIVLKDMLISFGFAATGGILSTVMVLGLLPFFEVSFGILSPLKLVELSNPNHPLLRKLLTEAPGTYHHSVMVGNLAETAAESIGANGLLCRVGSFYHDIGKTKRPSYFIENQVNMENPHDSIEPNLSKSIIIAHARDGVELLNEYKMPKQICDIAEQHHGTTLLGYFYHKALKQEKENPTLDEPITEEDYRYPGPKAQSKEAAIVGLADCVEAAVRSLRNPTIEHIDQMVDKIIKNRMEDDQFNECDLTLKELNTIGKSFKESLLGIFHSRIEYPDLPERN